jgi:hypothetical protein
MLQHSVVKCALLLGAAVRKHVYRLEGTLSVTANLS